MDIETLTQPNNVIAALTGLGVFATVVTLTSPSLGKSNLEGRLKSVANRREELRRRSREAMAQKTKGPANLRHTDEGLYKRVVEKLDLSRLLEDPKAVEKLAQAGLRGPKPLTTFYFFRFVAPFVFALAAAGYIFLINDFHLKGVTKFAPIFVGLFIGYYAPNFYISNLAAKRKTSIVGAFPDALDLLLICVEAGMSIEAAIAKVGAEIGSASLELAEELALVNAELSYLPDRRLAYDGLARRTNHPGIKSVSTALIQAEKYGTPLGSVLRVMAKENRELRLSAAEKKAASLPAKLTVPMILLFLPVLFIVIIGPAAINIAKTLGPMG